MLLPARSWYGLFVLCLIGCSGKYDVAQVSGLVTMDGKPLRNAHIAFSPIASGDKKNPGPSSHGKTDAKGRYSLRLAADGDRSEGAVVGKHRVMITGLNDEKIAVDDAGGAKIPFDPVPPHYRGTDTVLTFDVPAGGTDKADFKLSSKRKRP